jgi:hypothetical protein
LDRLARHRQYLEGEWRDLRAAPLSSRKAMLVAMLVDGMVDRLFEADEAAEDILEFRAAMGAASPALGRIMGLAERKHRLEIAAVAVPLAAYGGLSVADFMVSLYNDHSVMRLVLVTADGARLDMLATLEEAVAGLDRGLRPLARG